MSDNVIFSQKERGFIEKLEQAIDEKGNFLKNWVFQQENA